jgi:CheY-like chemotaxis protein
MSDAAPGATVLVIDDDPCIREELRDALQAWGYTVVEAENGKEGIKQVETSAPDVVITDIMMPEMDGIEVIRTLRASHPGLRIVALSGGDSQGYMGYLSAAGKLGADEVVSKPVPLAKLRRAIAGPG